MLSSGFVLAAAGFASNLILVRWIAPEGFGRFAIALATLGVVTTLFSMRLSTMIVRTPDSQVDGDAVRRWQVAIQLEALVLASVTTLWMVLSGLFEGWNIVLLTTLVGAQVVNNHRAVYERGQHYGQLATLETVSRLVAHGLAIALAIAGLGEGALYVRELAAVVLSAIGLRHFGALRLGRPGWFSAAQWRELLRDVRGLWADGLLESLFERARILAAAAVGGERGAGFFSQAQRLAAVPHQFLTPLVGRLALNWFSREEDPQRRARARRKLVALVALPLGVAAAGDWLLADPIVPWLLGEQWRPVVPLLIAMMGVIFFTGLFDLQRMFLYAVQGTRLILASRVAQFIGLGIPLAPLLWGETPTLEAAAWGVSLAFALAFVTTTTGLAVAERRRR